MNFKKMMALLATTSMSMTLLAGCGEPAQKETGSTDAGEKEVLSVYAFEGGNGAQIWHNIKDAFEAEKGVEVDLHLSSELDKDVIKAMQNGEAPDVVYYNLGQPSGLVETMLKEKAVADITDVFDADLKDRLVGGITDNAVAQPYGDGKIYLAPIMYTPTGLWYDANLVGEGKDYELPETWDDFFALGEKAKADGKALFAYPTSGYLDCPLFALMASAGGMDFYNQALSYGEGTWTSESGKKVVDTFAKVVSPEFMWKDTVANANSGNYKLNQQAVIDDEVLFLPCGNWVIGEMADSTPEGFEWAMMALPKFGADDSRYVYTYTEQMWVPADAKHMDLAKEFVKFMYSDKVVDLMLANESVNKETGEATPAPIVPPVKGAADQLAEGPVKDSYKLTEQEGYEAISGNWATTKTINGFDLKQTVYEAADALNTGDLTADDYQNQLDEAWTKLRENLD